jgi:hypothetical protein
MSALTPGDQVSEAQVVPVAPAPIEAGNRVVYAADGPQRRLRGVHGTVEVVDHQIAMVRFDGHAALWLIPVEYLAHLAEVAQ